MVNLASATLDDNSFAAKLREAPSNALIFMEDIDAIFRERTSQERTGITFSGLLNALDGVGAQEGKLLFMTTNHRERLDPALIRPGRCDLQVELPKASRAMMIALFTRF